MNGAQLKPRCEWNGNCGLEFANAMEYRCHCIEHIEANIAAARRLRNLSLPVETWTEVFSSCGPESLKERICFSQRWFHAIARLNLDGPRGRILPVMGFLKLNGSGGPTLRKHITTIRGYRLEDLPIAKVPPPQSVVGFSLIELRCFDVKVLSFMRAIRRLLKDVQLKIDNESSGALNVRVLEHLLHVFPHLDQAITTLRIRSKVIDAALFARMLSNVLYLECEALLPPYTLNDLHSPYIPALVKWLHTPAEGGHRKMANLNIHTTADLTELVTQAQEKFLSKNSVPRVSYFVHIDTHFSDAPMFALPFNTIHNERKELLTLRRRDFRFALYRRSSGVAEQIGQMVKSMHHKFSQMRNTLVLNVVQMSEIPDEQLLPMVDEPEDSTNAQESSKGD